MVKRASNNALCSPQWAVYSCPAFAPLKWKEGRLLREELDPSFLTSNELRVPPGRPVCVNTARETRQGRNGPEKKRTTGERARRSGSHAGTRGYEWVVGMYFRPEAQG
ncbi:unnamed protein product [Ixodes persulcatus]